MRQRASVTAEVMLGHPRVIEAEFFDFDDLFEQASVEIRQLSVELGHVSGQYMRTEFHRVAVVFPKRSESRQLLDEYLSHLSKHSRWSIQNRLNHLRGSLAVTRGKFDLALL